MSSISEGQRVSAAEAAKILGVSPHLISRLDPGCRWIKRYKLTRKTHVYDVDSLYQYLESRLSPPLQNTPAKTIIKRSPIFSKGAASYGQSGRSLLELRKPKPK